MAAQKFHQDQKVFAKVRGHPPWPAKITALLDETPNRQKFQVLFYGTRELGICKLDELYDYVEFKDKYGKGVKRKYFIEAMNEIELDLKGLLNDNQNYENHVDAEEAVNETPATTTAVVGATPTAAATDQDSDDEGNLVIDETPAQTKVVKSKPESNGPKSALKRKLSTGNGATPESIPEITSRSGRKIKPKKFLDEPADFTTPTSTKYSKAKSVKENNNDNHGKIRKTSENEVEMNGDRVELHWDTKQNVHDLMNKAEQSELPKTVKKDFKKSVKKKIDEMKPQQQQQVQSQQSLGDTENLELLKTEVQLLDADCRIKASLNLTGANCDDCLRAMDEILNLKLNAVMLKKHPEVVDTVKKLKKYVGNVRQWKLTPEQEEIFLADAERIRSKADTMYNKFKSLFTIPNGKTFYEVYTNEVNLFQQKTSSMSLNELYGTVREEPF